MKTTPPAAGRRGLLKLALALLPTACAGLARARASVPAELQMAVDAVPSRHLADEFSARAMAGERDAVIAMLSPALVQRVGPDSVAQVIDSRILPFFRTGAVVGRSTSVSRTTDAAGATGFAFYQWLEPRDGSAARPFTVYVVREQGRWVVANVVPDQRVAGRHR